MDLRTTYLGAAAWVGALAGSAAGPRTLGALVAGASVGAAAAAAGSRGSRRSWMVAAWLLTAGAVAASAWLRVEATGVSPVAALAAKRAVAETVLVVRSDPVLKEGRFGDYVVVRCQVRTAEARGRLVRSSVPVLVIGSEEWVGVPLGAEVRFTGRLAPATTPEHAAVLSGQQDPVVLSGPSTAMRAADQVRGSVRDAAAVGPDDAAALVPALVTGDDHALAEEVVDDFQTAGLTHLTAVSGTNLTLVLAALMLLARWARVGGRALLVLGLLGVVGFVLMARPEPSVIRAAAMGTVALLGMGSGGRAAGVRALGAAVLLLLVLDPWLARSPGFALSVMATGGILFVAPPFRDALATWMPRWLAEAVAVPLAAQLACTPMVAGLSGEVSLVAVAANLLVAPAVGPATVLGLVGGLIGLVAPPLGTAVSWLACMSAQLIVLVAHYSAELPTAAVAWSTSTAGLVLLTVLSVAALMAGPRLLRHRWLVVVVTVLLAIVVVRPLPSPGWPPKGWVMVMCDVGQGDALVMASGSHQGVVVDAGPDPALVDGCLRRLGITRVPAVVLTHFHADHVDGLPGVLRGRQVAEVQVTSFREPERGALRVDGWTSAAGVGVRVPGYGEVARAGPLSWEVLGPGPGGTDSPNDASVVVLAEANGVRILLTGDAEPLAQGRLLREELGTVDVLKVAHHGSSYQDERLLTGVGARVALISVGKDNDYGHPDAEVVHALETAGAVVRRTDRDGDVAVVVRDGLLRVVSRR